MTSKFKCPKCGAISGDDWSHCIGHCPMPMSPYHDPRSERDRTEVALIAESGVTAEEIKLQRETCCCGNPVEGHGYDLGHGPVSMWDYAVQCRMDAQDD